MDFGSLKRKHDDGNKGKGPYRKKNDEDNEELNPFRKAKKKAFDKETDTVPVEEEGSDIEEMAEGEAGHTAEEKMGEGDHEPGLFMEKEDLEDEEFPDDEDAEEDIGGTFQRKRRGAAALPKKKEPTFSFRRFL